MISRRGFFGALAGASALAGAQVAASERVVPGWIIEWGGWREPANQYVRVGFWMARRDPMPDTLPQGVWPYYYATTLGVVEGCGVAYALDMTRTDKNAPWLPHEPARKFEAAKAWSRQLLVAQLESL